MTHSIKTRAVRPADMAAISRLHAEVFGPGRYVRSAYRVREGHGEWSRYCRVADMGGRIIAALRMTEVAIGGQGGAALLGPIAVHPDFKGQGYGRRLISEAVAEMKNDGVSLVVLVGDMPYYGKLGFNPVPPGQIAFPGPVDPARILAAELSNGALCDYRGLVSASGASAEAGSG